MAREVLKIGVSSPASIANMGAGYDFLALAVNLRNQFTIYVDLRRQLHIGENEFKFEVKGDYWDTDRRINSAKTNLFAEAFERARKELCEVRDIRIVKYPITVCQSVDIPPIRGLGSSSSAAVAGVAAAIEFLRHHHRNHQFPGYKTDEDRELCASLAMAVDSCPDNVCASLCGGLTYSFVPDREWSDKRTYRGLHFFHQDVDDRDLQIVALVPELRIATEAARRVLENKQYKIEEVGFNIPRAVCIPAIIRSRRYALLQHALQDKIYQRQRAQEYFTLDKKPLDLEFIFKEVVDAGAYGACVSGSGSTLVAFCSADNVTTIRETFANLFSELAGDFIKLKKVYTLNVDSDGVAVERDPKDSRNAFQELTFDRFMLEVAAWRPRSLKQDPSLPPTPPVPNSTPPAGNTGTDPSKSEPTKRKPRWPL